MDAAKKIGNIKFWRDLRDHFNNHVDIKEILKIIDDRLYISHLTNNVKMFHKYFRIYTVLLFSK